MSLNRRIWAAAVAAALAMPPAAAQESAPPLTPLPTLDIAAYGGTWYQVAWFPNRFQRQCTSDTSATYRLLPGDRIEVTNRCKTADGRLDEAQGLARPAQSAVVNGQLQPATLEVSFLPAALRWLPIWGRYWVIQLAGDGRYAVVSEPSRQYLWVLSRTPALLPADESAIRSRLVQQGFDLGRWEAHPHTAAAAPR